MTSSQPMSAVVAVATSLSALCVCYGVVQLGRRYFNFVTNPLRSRSNNGQEETGIVGPGSSSDGWSFIWGQFWTIRKEPFMVPHKRWIEKSDKGWDAPFIFYTLMFGKSSICLLDKDVVKTVLMAPYSKSPLRFTKEISFLQNL
jgi:hypothetical protein